MNPPRLGPAVLLTATLALAAGCGSSEEGSGSGRAPQGNPPSTSAASGECQYVTTPQEPAARKVTPPPADPPKDLPARMTIKTSAGAIPVSLDAKAAPCAVNNFVSLAKQGYYDNTRCHRMTVGRGFQVLQCGDPTATGTGGPGYVFKPELTGKETYPAGTLAMARTSEPVSQGSQFFLVYGDTQLSPEYTVFGTIAKPGVNVIGKVAEKGVVADPQMGPGDGSPREKVLITSVK